MSNLAEAYPKEQERIRRAVQHGREIGPAGMFYVAMGEDLLRRADSAATSGDVGEMVKVYAEMREWKE